MEKEVFESPGLNLDFDKINDTQKKQEIPTGYEGVIYQQSVDLQQIFAQFSTQYKQIYRGQQQEQSPLQRLDQLKEEISRLQLSLSTQDASQDLLQQLDGLMAKQQALRQLDGLEYVQQHYLDRQSLSEHNMQDYLALQSKLASNRIVKQQEAFSTLPPSGQSQQVRLQLDLDKKNDKAIKMMKLSTLNGQLQRIEKQLGLGGAAGAYTDLIDKTNQVQNVIQALKIQNYDEYGSQIRRYIQQLEELSLSKEYLELEHNQVNVLREVQSKLEEHRKTIGDFGGMVSRMEQLKEVHQETANIVVSVESLSNIYLQLKEDHAANTELLALLDSSFQNNLKAISDNFSLIETRCKALRLM